MKTKKMEYFIELDELLASEFDYIAQTAIQANDDRSRVSSFYLIAVGSLIAALLGTQLFDPEKFIQPVKLAFSGAFALLTLLGISTVLQLARLRAAWHESMLAMNQLKDFAMKQNPELVNAFRWKVSTLPRKYKKGSVSYYQAREVALIGGLMFAISIFFLQIAFFDMAVQHFFAAIAAGIGMVYLELELYKRELQ